MVLYIRVLWLLVSMVASDLVSSPRGQSVIELWFRIENLGRTLMEAYFRMRNIVTDFYILRQRHRQLRAQIRKSIVSYLRQLHLLSQRVAKRSKFTYSASTVHVYARTCVYVCIFLFYKTCICSSYTLYWHQSQTRRNFKYHRVRPQWTFSIPNFFQALRSTSLGSRDQRLLLGAMSSIRREVRRCFHATGWNSRE